MNRHLIKIIIVILLCGLVLGAQYFHIGHYLTLDSIRENQFLLESYQENYPFVFTGIFFMAYVAITSLSIPGATAMTLLAGALFGLWQGLIIVSFASTIGATLAFLIARFLLRDWLQKKYPHQLDILNNGFKKEGLFYLFALRLIPLFPFFLINILTSIMPIKTRHFYAISQIGMLPGTMVYVYAGTQLSKLQSLADITSPSVLLSFILLGLFPLLAKKVIFFIRTRRKV